ncbi:MAG: hypothetical protein ACLRXQ_07255 [Phascolarctobacterium faecium]
MTAKDHLEKRIEGGRGRTTILNAKALSEYGRHMVKALREVNDSKIILPVMAYYGTSRMWKDNKRSSCARISVWRRQRLRRLYGASSSYILLGSGSNMRR